MLKGGGEAGVNKIRCRGECPGIKKTGTGITAGSCQKIKKLLRHAFIPKYNHEKKEFVL